MILLGESFQCAHKHKLGASVIFDDFVLVFTFVSLLICSLVAITFAEHTRQIFL